MKFSTLCSVAALSTAVLGAAIPRPIVSLGKTSWMSSPQVIFERIVVLKDVTPAIAVILPDPANRLISIGSFFTEAEEYADFGKGYLACYRATAKGFSLGTQQFVKCSARVFAGQAEDVGLRFADTTATFLPDVDLESTKAALLDFSNLGSRITITVTVALEDLEAPLVVPEVDTPKVDEPKPVAPVPEVPVVPVADPVVPVPEVPAPKDIPVDAPVKRVDLDTAKAGLKVPTSSTADAKKVDLGSMDGAELDDSVFVFLAFFSPYAQFIDNDVFTH